MKATKPGKYHRIAKEVGANTNNGNLVIECIEHLNPQEQVEKVAESFASVSQQYDPINLSSLPAYLPSEEPPQLNVYKVSQNIQNQKRTKRTLPIDIPDNLRKEAAVFLAEPLTDIFNTCLREGKYPKTWKHEWCTPVPKKKVAIKNLKDVRQIASTSDFSKIFEKFLIEYVHQDITHKLNNRQYGGKQGVGTEHLVVTLLNRIKKLLDDPENLTVVLSSYDWKGAFDRIDPTTVAVKLIELGLRSSIVKIIIDFLNEQKMEVKINKCTFKPHDLIGGGPQGSLIGQLLYIIASDDVAEDIPEEDKFKYIDDLSALEAVQVKDKLKQYDVHQHVPSDVPTGQMFLPSATFRTQKDIEGISQWTTQNKMILNEDK